jgi:hypothetical protein
VRVGILVGLVVMSSALVACSSDTGETAGGLPDDATVTYAFHDSSVPPEYHRSETLTVTKGQAHLVIDSYGDVLADETVATPAAVWDELGRTLPEVSSLEAETVELGCTGGTSADLTVESASGIVVDLSPEFCGGTNPELEAPMAGWIQPARDLFPSTDVLAPEGP